MEAHKVKDSALVQVTAVLRLLRAPRIVLRIHILCRRAVQGHEPGQSHAALGGGRQSEPLLEDFWTRVSLRQVAGIDRR